MPSTNDARVQLSSVMDTLPTNGRGRSGSGFHVSYPTSSPRDSNNLDGPGYRPTYPHDQLTKKIILKLVTSIFKTLYFHIENLLISKVAH